MWIFLIIGIMKWLEYMDRAKEKKKGDTVTVRSEQTCKNYVRAELPANPSEYDSFERALFELRLRFEGRGMRQSVRRDAKRQSLAVMNTRALAPGAYADYGTPTALNDRFRTGECDGMRYMTSDDFVRYYKDLENAYIAVLQSEDGETYTQIDNEGAPSYAMVLPEGNVLNGLINVFMMSKTVEFNVPIQVNGEEIGVMTLADFMKKTPVGDAKVTTGMFDGSFKYKFGEATYRGRFLGIDLETFIAKLAALEMPIEGNIVEVEYYGINGLDKEGKNVEYTLYPDEPSYFGNVSFIVMYDGMVNNPAVKDIDLGLTAFINNNGQKWITYNLTAINFITE